MAYYKMECKIIHQRGKRRILVLFAKNHKLISWIKSLNDVVGVL
jgi:hypothetical protein